MRRLEDDLSLDQVESVVVDTVDLNRLRLNERSFASAMSYEPGSLDCRLLIDAKHHVEHALASLSSLPQSDHIQRQLRAVHQQLEGMHDLKRKQPLHSTV